MSKVWKWIFGILAVLIVVSLFAGGAFMWRNRGLYMGARASEAWGSDRPGLSDEQGVPRGYEGYPGYHMRGWGGGMPMMGYGYGYSPYGYGHMGYGFMPFGGFFHMLIPLGLLALVAYIFYQMGKRAGSAPAPAPSSAPASDVQSPPARKVARR